MQKKSQCDVFAFLSTNIFSDITIELNHAFNFTFAFVYQGLLNKIKS